MVKGSADGAWWVRVRGVVLPRAISGHPALELPNTWAGWSPQGVPLHPDEQSQRDYLRSAEHLDVLARDRGLLAEDAPGSDPASLEEARRLRPVAYRLARGAGGRADLDLVADLAAEARAHSRLVRSDDGSARWVLQPSAGPRAVVLAAGSALADLLTLGAPQRVRSCPGHDCGWLFLDSSGRRRWCQMAVCGNRAKQAAFQARRPHPTQAG